MCLLPYQRPSTEVTNKGKTQYRQSYSHPNSWTSSSNWLNFPPSRIIKSILYWWSSLRGSRYITRPALNRADTNTGRKGGADKWWSTNTQFCKGSLHWLCSGGLELTFFFFFLRRLHFSWLSILFLPFVLNSLQQKKKWNTKNLLASYLSISHTGCSGEI